MNILLVSPTTPATFWSFRHAIRFISKKAAFPPLGLLTVAAMLPADWNLRLVDLNVSRLQHDDLEWADYVFLSGMIINMESCRAVAARCAAHGKTIIAGGPLFTTCHEQFPEIRHVVIGEAEDIMPALVADMQTGRLQPFYEGRDKPDIRQSPVPRWDLIDFKHYAMMSVQFSRGCPFNCEFCDIIVMYGRVPRVKTPEQVVRELDALLHAGWRGAIFVVDDNFVGNRAKVKILLRAMIDWRRRQRISIAFTTEASLNLVDDPELLDLMVQAGFKKVFIGLETPNPESLVECAKVQNTNRDMVGAIRQLQNAGIEVMGGFILGFDSDQPTIFERQLQFIQEAGVVTAMVGLLNALPKTRLFTRLASEGRILRQTTGNNLDAVLNFIPKLDRDVLVEGYRTLVKKLYAPKTYYRRALTFLREYRRRGPKVKSTRGELAAFFKSMWVMGVWSKGRRAYWLYLLRSLLFHRRAFAEAVQLAILGHHFRKIAKEL